MHLLTDIPREARLTQAICCFEKTAANNVAERLRKGGRAAREGNKSEMEVVVFLLLHFEHEVEMSGTKSTPLLRQIQ